MNFDPYIKTILCQTCEFFGCSVDDKKIYNRKGIAKKWGAVQCGMGDNHKKFEPQSDKQIYRDSEEIQSLQNRRIKA